MDETRNDSKYFEDGVRSGRKQSPDVEYAFQDAVRAALTELLESKGLYQNVTINERFSSSIPVVKTHSYNDEFSSRPLYLFSRGDSEAGQTYPGHTGGALGTRQFEMDVGCYLPDIQIYCPICKRETGFISHSSSNAHFLSPYPKIGKTTEQIYSPLYRCSKCREQLINFQILRRGFKLQLTGRSLPYRPKIDSGWPKVMTNVISDALVAVAENDIPAGYYHLRTAIEFYIKKEIGFELDTKIDGTELCEKYYEIIDNRLKSDFPNINNIYSKLSSGLHTRNCSEEEFKSLKDDLLNHFKAKQLFKLYASEEKEQ